MKQFKLWLSQKLQNDQITKKEYEAILFCLENRQSKYTMEKLGAKVVNFVSQTQENIFLNGIIKSTIGNNLPQKRDWNID